MNERIVVEIDPEVFWIEHGLDRRRRLVFRNEAKEVRVALSRSRTELAREPRELVALIDLLNRVLSEFIEEVGPNGNEEG